jgi:hypothetical protein
MRYVLVLFCVGIACLVASLLIEGPPRVEVLSPPSLSLRHERTSTEHSRCDECPQPGDVLKAHLEGSPLAVHGISVYRNELHAHSCIGCDDLSSVADGIGRYTVVGFQLDRHGSCELPCGGLDTDIVALMRCGAVVTTKTVDVR